MKGKKILALVSIFAGVALVGATFADWVVTDNAAAKTIKITGEKIQGQTDDKSYVTLSYGESTSINDVANFEAGTKRYAGAVGLVATYTGATSYKGRLDVSLSQPSREGVRLIDYLTVKIVDKLPTKNADNEISAYAAETTTYVTLTGTGETPVLSGSYVFNEMGSEDEEVVYIAVEFDDTGVDASVLNTIKSDVVSLVLDWNHEATGQTVSTGTTVFYKPTGAHNDKVYCWAWGGKLANADEFPGVLMTKDANNNYTYTVDAEYTSFILSYEDSNGVNHQTGEFHHSDVSGANNYWDGTKWTTKPVADSTLTYDYYLVGSMNGWNCQEAYGLAEDSEHEGVHYTLTKSLTAGDKFKIRTSTNASEEHWYASVSTWDGCGFTIDNEGNLVVTQTGERVINLWLDATSSNNYVSFTAVPSGD